MIEVKPLRGAAPPAASAITRRHGDLDILRYQALISLTDGIWDDVSDARHRCRLSFALSRSLALALSLAGTLPLARNRGLSLVEGFLNPFDEP
jgi:hypothetical protein